MKLLMLSLADSTIEHEAEGNSQKGYKAKRQSVRNLEAIHQEWWIKGERMLHAAQPPNHMKPSTQLLAHSKDNMFSWMVFRFLIFSSIPAIILDHVS